MGKKKVEDEESDSDSDSDVDDEDSDADEGAVTRSIILDDGNCSNGSTKSELDPGSASGSPSEGESSGEKSRLSEDENVNSVQETMDMNAGSGAEGNFESDSSLEPEGGMVEQPTFVNGTVATLEERMKSDEVKENVDNTASTTSNQSNPEVPQVEESVDENKSTHSDPLDLAEYSSAAELEVFTVLISISDVVQ